MAQENTNHSWRRVGKKKTKPFLSLREGQRTIFGQRPHTDTNTSFPLLGEQQKIPLNHSEFSCQREKEQEQ